MDFSTQKFLIILFLVIDIFSVFVPLTAVLVLVVILAKPMWFKELVDKLYSE